MPKLVNILSKELAQISLSLGFKRWGFCLLIMGITFLTYGQESSAPQEKTESGDDPSTAPIVLSPAATSRKVLQVVQRIQKSRELAPQEIQVSQEIQTIAAQHNTKKRSDQKREQLISAIQRYESEIKEQEQKANQIIQSQFNLYLVNLKKNLPQKNRHANYTAFNRKFKPPIRK